MSQRFALVTALALCLASAAAGAARADSLSFTSNMVGDKDVITCSDVDISFWKDSKGHDGIVTVQRDQTVTVRAPGSGALRLIAPNNGGVWVQPSTNGEMTAIVCEAAGDRSESSANTILDQVRIVNQGGELRVEGPGDNWGAYIILSVPKGVALDMSAANGGLTVRGVQGTFTLHTTNGPIGIAHVTGKVVARATNGPISFLGHEGDMDLRGNNGPVKVHLDGPTWNGKGLDASTDNGPIKVIVPDGMRTGVRIEGSENSHLQWKERDQDSKTVSDWYDNRSIKIGDGPVLVRVSTVNGPVSISAPGMGKGRI